MSYVDIGDGIVRVPERSYLWNPIIHQVIGPICAT